MEDGLPIVIFTRRWSILFKRESLRCAARMATVIPLAISCHHRLLLLLRLLLLSLEPGLVLLTIEIGCRFQSSYLLLAYRSSRISHCARLEESRLRY